MKMMLILLLLEIHAIVGKITNYMFFDLIFPSFYLECAKYNSDRFLISTCNGSPSMSRRISCRCSMWAQLATWRPWPAVLAPTSAARQRTASGRFNLSKVLFFLRTWTRSRHGGRGNGCWALDHVWKSGPGPKRLLECLPQNCLLLIMFIRNL